MSGTFHSSSRKNLVYMPCSIDFCASGERALRLKRLDLSFFSPGHGRKDSQQNDAQIETEGPILNVIQIMFDALSNRSVPAPSVYLGPPRDSHLETMALVIA